MALFSFGKKEKKPVIRTGKLINTKTINDRTFFLQGYMADSWQ